MQTHFTTLCLWWLRSRCFRILVNPTTGGSRPLGGILTNLYLSISSVTVPSWRWRRGFLSWRVENVSMTYRICILRASLSVWSFLFMIILYANCGAILAITSTTYMTTVELFDEYSAPFSPEVIRSLIRKTNIYIEWHNIIHGNRKECQSLLLRGISSGPGPSSPLTCFLSWHAD